MFDVLVYVYENYWRPEACPAPEMLGRKLAALGFEDEEIQEALDWLSGLSQAAQYPEPPASTGFRVYSAKETAQLDSESIGFLSFLSDAGVLPGHMREIVIERAMALPGAPVTLEGLKVIVLMVFWSFGEEPDALVLDELFVDPADRVLH